jgi:hypothetical protein
VADSPIDELAEQLAEELDRHVRRLGLPVHRHTVDYVWDPGACPRDEICIQPWSEDDVPARQAGLTPHIGRGQVRDLVTPQENELDRRSVVVDLWEARDRVAQVLAGDGREELWATLWAIDLGI